MDIQNYTVNGSFPSDFIQKRYLIIGHQVDNLGDLACAVKVANSIHRRFSVPKEQITLTSNQPGFVQIFNKYQFKVLSYKEALIRTEDDLFIAAPASAPELGNFLKLGKPIVCINEYDHEINAEYQPFPWIRWASFGLGPNKIGILISNKLAKAGFSPDILMTLERMQLLAKIDPVLKQGLLGEKSVEEFSYAHVLYVSYTSQANAKLAFIRAIIQLNHEMDKNLIFISPGIGRRGISPELLQKQSYPGVSCIRLYQYDYADKKFDLTFSQEQDPLGSKTVSVICGSFQYQDLKKLYSYSEKETLATGDQSISEAISANKSWLYEKLLHKRTFANQLDSRTFNQTKKSVCLADNWEYMYEIFRERKDDNYQKMTETNHLLKERDCTSALSKLIEKALAPSQMPALIQISTDKESLTPEDLPLDTPVVMTSSQLCALKIRTQTRESEFPIFQGSVFKSTVLTGDLNHISFLVIRCLKDK